MAIYKGIEVKESVRSLLPHMAMVEEYREMLQSLQAVWDNLNLLGQLSGTTAEIGQTREAFSSLTSDLLNNLAERTLAKREQEMTAKSQVVIDILTRNLFERTADIGFLTTDDVIRQFAAQPGDPSELQRRFLEYVRKYSVYEDVVLLSTDGRVLARLQPDQRVANVADAWVGESVRSTEAYVEAYGRSDLFPDRASALIYAYRVTTSQGETLGVLALCFRFADEMERIFRSLSRPDDAGVLALLDASGQVIASSDRWQVPLGAELDVPVRQMQRLRFAGRSYLAFASATHGYQGYMGPGWRGLVMLPVEQAFEMQEDEPAADLAPAMLASVMSGGRAFPETLQAIPRKAEAIQRDLSRSVWNGTVRQGVSSSSSSNAAFSKILLWEISRVGMRMREVFSSSIGNLQTTVLSSLLSDSQFFASLAIDIMDRNLYERANDCRWWALDPTMRRLMSSASGSARQEGLEKVLRYINGLYTVYDNLLIFDTAGCVVAVSNSAYAELVGQPLNEPWVEACLGLRDSQCYTVSEFATTRLYANRPTYNYAATLRAPDDSRVIGGIAIVFDSAPQFAAMLHDSLPRESSGEVVEGSFAVFLDARAGIIASTAPAYRVGETMVVPEDLLNAPPQGVARLIELDGQVMAVGARRSSGYREFKGVDDAYRNEVTALVCMPLGAYKPDALLSRKNGEVASRRAAVALDVPTVEIATFHVGGHWLGLPVVDVVEAIELTGAARLPNAPKQVYGALLHRGDTLPLYDLHAALGLVDPDDAEPCCQVVVVKGRKGSNFGILVDRLGEILESPISDIDSLANVYVGVASVLASVVKTPQKDGAAMLVQLSVESMTERLHG